MERSLASKVALLLVAVACVWLDYAVVSGIHRFIWDRQAADIQDVPIYAAAKQVAYLPSEIVKDSPGERCPEMSFEATDSSYLVQTFYKTTLIGNDRLPKRDWLGDGWFYPPHNPVTFYRKAGGVFQRLIVYTAAGDGQQVPTHTQIWLCVMH